MWCSAINQMSSTRTSYTFGQPEPSLWQIAFIMMTTPVLRKIEEFFSMTFQNVPIVL